jgi:hypothetical protein
MPFLRADCEDAVLMLSTPGPKTSHTAMAGVLQRWPAQAHGQQKLDSTCQPDGRHDVDHTEGSSSAEGFGSVKPPGAPWSGLDS